MNKKDLSERDICSKYITPALINAGWDLERQIREEVTFTDGRIIVRKKLVTRGERKRADYILYYKSNIPLAIIEAKDNKHPVGAGMQQALNYAEILDIPFAFSSNGDAFLEHDRTIKEGKKKEKYLLTGSHLLRNCGIDIKVQKESLKKKKQLLHRNIILSKMERPQDITSVLP
nr:type I restriction endonuclease [Thermoclostridium stercorarium]